MASSYLRIFFLICCVVLISQCSEDPTLPQDTKDTTSPSVVSTSPSNDATGVSVNTTISATFSEDMDSSTVKTTTFLVSNGATGTVSYNDKVATFTLDAALDSFTVYEATLTTGIEDEAGNELSADYVWSFRTISSQENQPPIADAGPDQDVNKENVVTLDGSGSSDPEDATLTYKWTQVLGPDVTGGSGELTGANPTFTAPSEVSTIQFDLVVNDGINDSDPGHVQINIMENKNLAVFVSPNGNDDNPGTRSLPVRSLLTAYSMAASGAADVYLAGGIHHLTTTLTLVDGVSLYGGFRESDWARAGDAGSTTTIDVGAPTAILASNINTTTMLDVLIINGGDAPSPGGSTYGIRVSNSLGLILSRCDINAGKGGDGTNGTTHTSAAAAGGEGGMGQAGCENSSGLCDTCPQPYGGNGGSSAAGNQGGVGGRPRGGTNPGNPGLPGAGATGGAGGPGTPANRGDWNTDQSFWGANGGNGVNGVNGDAGMEGNYGSSGYLTIGGGDGSGGTAGSGGGGGGGGGGGDDSCDSYGGGGGGGGGGGAGGLGGEGGHSGGGSFAVYLWASQVLIQECDLATDGSGRGGNGSQGQQGGNGGLGGRYPQGSTSGKGNPYGGADEQDDGSNGARGGDGGLGGDGGYGGGGAGGPSIGVLIGGGSTADLYSVNYSIGSAGAGGSGGNSGPAGPRHNTYIP